MSNKPPRAEKRPVIHTLHGDHRIDEYAWLRDDNWQQVMREPEVLRADVRAYLEAENAHTANALAGTEVPQAALFRELRGRIKAEDSSVPASDGPWAYYQRFEEGSQHPIFCRRPSAEAGGAEQVILDANLEAEDKPFFCVSAVAHSPDHALYAFAADNKGSELHAVCVLDLATGGVVDEAVRDTSGALAWCNDSRTFYYTVLDDNLRPSRVYRHRVGTPRDDDKLIYDEADPGVFVGIGITESRRYLVVSAHDHVTSEIHVMDADDPEAALRLIVPREKGVEAHAAHHGNCFLIHTNAGGAEDFRIVEALESDPGPGGWRDVVPHVTGRLILGMQVFRDHLVWQERVDGLPRIVVRRLTDGEEHEITFSEKAFDLSMVPVYEFDTAVLRFAYSSLTTPGEIYDYNMGTRERTLRKRQEIPSGHDPGRYDSQRIMARAPDGEDVPVSILWRHDTPLDGTAPLLLYGYGAYGASMPASFSPNRFSLVDRGFVYAIAHIRGGTDRGYRWYREGRGPKKANTFTDFVAVAEGLVAGGYTYKGGIAAFGGSAGGMLVGAVLNMRPDLFGAAVAEVPFVDVLNTMIDESLPLTPPEWPEWGNPVADEDAYRTILSYSPYDNVAAVRYPPILVTAGLSDPRVTYWEPAKWVARLRAKKVGDDPLLLKTNMSAGHSGASGRFAKLEEIALIYAFLLMVFGRLDRVEAE
jgi:oligopeptidase B